MNNIPEFTVSEFSRTLKRIVEDNFGYVKIRGEISGFKKASSGHLYFSLKDENALLAAVCFKNMAELINFEVSDGLEVTASGRITTYEGRSNYQIIVEKLEIAGIGTIMEAIEKRRKKLLAEGLFDEEHKKPLPFFPKIIGVVTSPTGAVIEDIIHRISDRFPTNLLLYPASVQGKMAALEVIAGIKYFNRLAKESRPDVIIIARGGGSFEDLLPFSDEDLVRAVFKSEIPIISAVGHETDTTLIDYVSDVRVPTPTAAAEIATPVLRDLKNSVQNFEQRLKLYFDNFFSSKQQNLENLSRHLIHPTKIIESAAQRCLELSLQLKNSLLNAVRNKEQELKLAVNLLTKPNFSPYENKLNLLQKDLVNFAEHNFKLRENRINLAEKLLESYNYKKVLNRGYALVRGAKSELISSKSQVKNNSKINVELSDGNFAAVVFDENISKDIVLKKKSEEKKEPTLF